MESQAIRREILDRIIDAAQLRAHARDELERAIVDGRQAGLSATEMREASGYASNKTIYNILEKHQVQ